MSEAEVWARTEELVAAELAATLGAAASRSVTARRELCTGDRGIHVPECPDASHSWGVTSLLEMHQRVMLPAVAHSCTGAGAALSPVWLQVAGAVNQIQSSWGSHTLVAQLLERDEDTSLRWVVEALGVETRSEPVARSQARLRAAARGALSRRSTDAGELCALMWERGEPAELASRGEGRVGGGRSVVVVEHAARGELVALWEARSATAGALVVAVVSPPEAGALVAAGTRAGEAVAGVALADTGSAWVEEEGVLTLVGEVCSEVWSRGGGLGAALEEAVETARGALGIEEV